MAMDGLSIIIRGKTKKEIYRPLSSIDFHNNIDVIAVIYSNSYYEEILSSNIQFIFCNARRIEAKYIGVKLAKYNKILFLDSDQIVSRNLVPELLSVNYDMAYVPERSLSNGFMAKVLDSKRKALEKKAKTKIDITLPVVPRYFKKDLLIKTFRTLDEKIIKNEVEMEDTMIFFTALKFSKNVGWVNSFIYNYDPDFKTFIKKSYKYGIQNELAIIKYLPPEYARLVRRVEIETILNNRIFSVGTLVSNMLRGLPYLAGSLVSRLKGGGS